MYNVRYFPRWLPVDLLCNNGYRSNQVTAAAGRRRVAASRHHRLITPHRLIGASTHRAAACPRCNNGRRADQPPWPRMPPCVHAALPDGVRWLYEHAPRAPPPPTRPCAGHGVGGGPGVDEGLPEYCGRRGGRTCCTCCTCCSSDGASGALPPTHLTSPHHARPAPPNPTLFQLTSAHPIPLS
jgi:hypothetical protein